MIAATATLTVLLLGQTSHAFAPSRLGHTQLLNQQHRHASTTKLYIGDFFNFGKKEEESPVADKTPVVEEEDEEYYDDDDPIEKIFGVFFGKKEKNPGG